MTDAEQSFEKWHAEKASCCENCQRNCPHEEWERIAWLAARADVNLYREALEWLVNLGCDVGKAGGTPEINEYEEAIDFGKATLVGESKK